MIYPVTIIGNPTLRKKAEEINKDYPQLEEIIENMWETMYSSDGVGLAAPQINKSIRLVVIDGEPMADEDETLKGFKKVFINPTMIETRGEQILFNEGCLSIPGIREDVSRPSEITLRYYDTDFKEHTQDFKGVAARIIQHEYDHLEGVLFTDRLSAFRRKLLKSKLVAISKGEHKAPYRTIPNK